jgi:phage/plasmid primase-like uncharacterized protein
MKANELKTAAWGRWPEILSSLAGLPIEILDGKHHPCPKCGGTDRFRFTNQDEDGSLICNQCGKCGDGIAALQWALDIDFKEACKRLAEYLGIKPRKKAIPPGEQILFLSSDRKPAFAREWLKHKEGTEYDQLMRCRWAAAAWPKSAPPENRYAVLAFEFFDPLSWKGGRFILYRRDGQKFRAYKDSSERKAHIVGKGDGLVIVGAIDEFKAAREVWKCEGLTDALAVSWLLDGSFFEGGEIAVANVCGAGSFSPEWQAAFEGKSIVVIGDNDSNRVGEQGADKAIGVLCG